MIRDKRLPREVVEGKNVIPDKIRSGTCVTQLGLSDGTFALPMDYRVSEAGNA